MQPPSSPVSPSHKAALLEAEERWRAVVAAREATLRREKDEALEAAEEHRLASLAERDAEWDKAKAELLQASAVAAGTANARQCTAMHSSSQQFAAMHSNRGS